MEQIASDWVSHLYRTSTPDISDLYFLFDTLGADVETRIYNGRTPLMLLVDIGWTEGARILLYEFNAIINAQDPLGLTPLVYALTSSRQPSLPIVELLLSHPDVNIHMRGPRFLIQHPLHYACLSGEEGFVHLLLAMITEKEILKEILFTTKSTCYQENIEKSRILIQKALSAMQKRPRPDDL